MDSFNGVLRCRYDIALVYYEGAADALKKQVRTIDRQRLCYSSYILRVFSIVNITFTTLSPAIPFLGIVLFLPCIVLLYRDPFYTRAVAKV